MHVCVERSRACHCLKVICVHVDSLKSVARNACLLAGWSSKLAYDESASYNLGTVFYHRDPWIYHAYWDGVR